MIPAVTRALAPATLLLAYALAFATTALGRSLPVFDDHPGQYFRLWHGLTRGLAPWVWNPDWWTGYAELQYYPPGFVYLGALIHYLALGSLPPTGVYTMLVWIIYAIPGLTVFLLLARVLPHPWLALPGAFVALTMSMESLSGVEGGVRTGMIAARLGWALLPVLAVALLPWIHDGRRWPWMAAPVLAAIVLSHPAHAPAGIMALTLAAMSGDGRRRDRMMVGLGVGVGAALLTAFWTVPLLAHLDGARALAWGEFSWGALARQLVRPTVLPLTALALAVGLMRLAGRHRTTIPSPWPMVFAWPLAMLAVISGDVSSWIPRDRLVDSFLLVLVIAGGAGLGLLIDRLAANASARAVASAASVLALCGLSALDPGALTLWPRAVAWPTLDETERGLRLPALWAALNTAPPGRVLFVRSGVPLVYGTEWYRPHTHLSAMTPLYTGRSIVHGTFTHPSPIAALVYTGSAAPGPITTLAERLDGQSLFGRPLADITAQELDRMMDALGVSTVVLLDDDRGRFPALEANPAFTPITTPPFIVHARRSPQALPRMLAPGHWRLDVSAATNGWAPARLAYSPLWRASRDGRGVALRRNREGGLEVQVPGPAVVDLFYGPGTWEHAGVAVTASAVLVLGAAALRRRVSSG
jgi:hypothetical protein